MKKLLLIVALLAMSLSACSKKPDADLLDDAKKQAEYQAQSEQGKKDIKSISGKDGIYIYCILGTTYVYHGHGFLIHRDAKSDKPVACDNTPFE